MRDTITQAASRLRFLADQSSTEAKRMARSTPDRRVLLMLAGKLVAQANEIHYTKNAALAEAWASEAINTLVAAIMRRTEGTPWH